MQMKQFFDVLRTWVLLGLCSGLGAVMAQSGSSATGQPPPKAPAKAQAKVKTLVFSCRVLYSPARSIWVRELEVDYNKKAFTALRIDGIPVYGFSAEGAQISTHLDNERIYLDLNAPSWRSEFREAAQGEGACVKSKS
jgi:hypothetical protein